MTILYTEGFETDGNGSRYTTSTPEFTDGSGDFFVRTDGSDIGSFYEVSGQTDSYYFAAMDVDGEGASATQSLLISDIDIAGYENLSFSGLFAEDDDSSNQDWDADTSVVFEYRIDGGAWTNLLAFGSQGATNTEPGLDTDFDGIADSTTLTAAFSLFSAAISGTGALLDIRVTFNNLDAGDEDFALDDLTVTGDAVVVASDYDLQVTEIWMGQVGDDVTADWFEITNNGPDDWVQGVNEDLYYDDNSQSVGQADQILGLTSIAAGSAAIVVVGTAADAQQFIDVWSKNIDLTGVEVGYTDGAGLGPSGDGVTLFRDNAGSLEILDFESYPDVDGNDGQSWDAVAGDFSQVGVDGAVATTDQGNGDTVSAVGSPGNGEIIPVPDFTLELFHLSDQEGDASALANAPNLSAVLNALKAQDLGDDGVADNTLLLSSGDVFLPGAFFDASEAVFGSGGIADIQIQNELGVQAIALGNHEFDLGPAYLASLIDGSAPGDFSALVGSTLEGQDFTGTDMPYLSTNLDVPQDPDLGPTFVAGGGAPAANISAPSVVIDVNGEPIGVVGVTTPILASISDTGSVGVDPDWAGPMPTEAELNRLVAEIQPEVDLLLANNPDMNKVILLSHMQQIEIELELAARLTGVDIIVAGGSNTLLSDDNDRLRDGDVSEGAYPQFVENAGGTQTAVVNTDGSYSYLGRLVIDFDADGNIIADSYDSDVSGAYATDDQGVADLGAEGLVDQEIQDIVDALEAQIILTEGNVLGYSDVFLNGNRSGDSSDSDPDGVRSQETNLGNLTADANLWTAQQFDADVMFSLKNGAGIRDSIGETVVPAGGTEAVRTVNRELLDGDGNVIKGEGGISQTDVESALSLNSNLVLLTLTVEEIVGMLEHGISSAPGEAGAFPQISGAKFSYDDTLPAGDRIVEAVLEMADGTQIVIVEGGEIVNGTDTYRIVTVGFIAEPRFDGDGNFTGGGAGYPIPNLNEDESAGELGDPDVIARVNFVDLTEAAGFTGNATFAEDGSEQDALAEYLIENHGSSALAYDEEDGTPGSDERIQNLSFREGSVIIEPAESTIFSFVQDFDSEATGAQYVDTGDAGVDHDLINNAGQAVVDSEVSGIAIDGTLAFDATYVNSRGDVGLTDGDFVGVNSFAGTVGAFTSGDRGYELQDTDGQMILTFETVNTFGVGEVDVTIDVFFQSTTWESDDYAQVGVDTDGDGVIDVFLLNTLGQNIDDLNIEGEWITLTTTLDADVAEATLIVSLDSNSSSESLYIDSIGIATAAPSSFTYGQSFEEEEVRSKQYRDAGDPSVDHDLENSDNDNRRKVDSVNSGLTTNGQLAYDATFTATRGTEGMTDGANTGVTDRGGWTGGFTDGVTGYEFRDTDGLVGLTFEEIDTSGADLITVSVDAYVADTIWEQSDLVRIGVDTDGDGSIDVDLVNTEGLRAHRALNVGEWVTYTAQVIQPESVSVIVEIDSNVRDEAVMIDNILISGESDVAGIAAAPAPEAQGTLSYSVASISTVAGGAEIVAKLEGEATLVVTNGNGLTFYDITDITAPVVSGTFDPTSEGADSSEVTSVSANGLEIAFAVPAADTVSNGHVFFGSGGVYDVIEVGPLPDMVTFDESGDYLLVANEGESSGDSNQPDAAINPNGSVSIIQIDRDGDGNPTGTYTTTTFDFSDASLTAEALAAKGVRINPNAPSVAADIEPEFITIEGNTAYISLQENNAVAIIDDITTFTGFTIDNIVTAGSVDHLQVGNGIDASDKDGDTVNIETRDVVGLNMPDGIVAFSISGTTFFASANEGDSRDVDESRVEDLVLDASEYPDAAALQAEDELGRLQVSNIDGDINGDGDVDQLTSFGSRSFTIFDEDGNEVFNSGDLLARIVLEERGEAGYPDSRSDAKGVEPEYVEFGSIDGKPYLFVGLERADAVVVFDITDPANPVYDAFIDLPTVEEPEGLKFISADDSPSGQPLLVVAGEDNDSLAIIELDKELTLTSIGEVQGSGDASALDGTEVSVRGVVVGDYSEAGQLTGFYIQSTDAEADGDDTTSDGIFVYLGDALDTLPEVNEGDLVTVTGTVDEFFDQTQIDTVSFLEVEATGQLGQVTAATVNLPGGGSYEDAATYEQYEGMLITIPQELFVSEYFQLARYGQVVLTEGARPYQYTQQNTPDVDGYNAHLEALGQSQIILDDDNNIDNAYLGDDDVIPLPDGGLSVDNYFRGGDSVTDLTGVLSWSWAGSSGTDAWRLRPTEGAPITFDSNEVVEETPADVGGSLKVASFNVLNYFTTIDDGSDSGVNASPNGGPRGANSQAELDRQTDKLVDAMLTMDADVFGLVEIENEFGDQNGDGRFAVQYLVDALNAAAGSDIYDYVDPGVGVVDSSDVITGAFIYKTTTVEITAGSTVAILNDSTNPLAGDFANAVFDGVSTNRAALAASFTELATGESFTAAVNHFKSKGSVNAADGNTDAGDGAGNNNAIRLQASQSLDAWLETDPTGSGDTRTLILGDLNAYAKEDPITYLEDQGYTDLARAFEGEDAYSYLFDSQLGTLDYALSDADLTPFVTGATEWHINADELPLFDYNDDILDAGESSFNEEPGGNDLYNVDPFRTSDHDPVIIGLDLDAIILA